MIARVTAAQLEAAVNRLNRITGSPQQPYANGLPREGNYHLSGSYGGWALHRMTKDGGTFDVLNTGHINKRDLINRMYAYTNGIAT
jgi:hypothetical protein